MRFDHDKRSTVISGTFRQFVISGVPQTAGAQYVTPTEERATGGTRKLGTLALWHLALWHFGPQLALALWHFGTLLP
jgi:hypothetical protein